MQTHRLRMTALFVQNVFSTYYRRDKGTNTTNKQSRTNEKKNNIFVLPFSRVGKSKSVCIICKHKNTGLAMVPAKPKGDKISPLLMDAAQE